MAQVSIAPDWAQHFHDDTGSNPASGWEVWTFESRTEDKVETYNAESGGAKHSNPIILSPKGEYPGQGLYLLNDTAYTLELRRPDGSVVKTVDNVVGTGSNALDGLVLGTTETTAHRGDQGYEAYQHSQDVTTNPHNVTADQIGLGDVDNTSDADKPISDASQAQFEIIGDILDDTVKTYGDQIINGAKTFNYTPRFNEGAHFNSYQLPRGGPYPPVGSVLKFPASGDILEWGDVSPGETESYVMQASATTAAIVNPNPGSAWEAEVNICSNEGLLDNMTGDTDGHFDLATGVFTAPEDGYYYMHCQSNGKTPASSSSEECTAWLYTYFKKGNIGYFNSGNTHEGTTNRPIGTTSAGIMYLSAGTTVEPVLDYYFSMSYTVNEHHVAAKLYRCSVAIHRVGQVNTITETGPVGPQGPAGEDGASATGTPYRLPKFDAGGDSTDSQIINDDFNNIFSSDATIVNPGFGQSSDNFAFKYNSVEGQNNATIGYGNDIQGNYVNILGNQNDVINGSGETIIGYDSTSTNTSDSTMAGYYNNITNGDTDTIFGSYNNILDGTGGNHRNIFGENNDIPAGFTNCNFFGKYFRGTWTPEQQGYGNYFGGQDARSMFMGQWADRNGFYPNSSDGQTYVLGSVEASDTCVDAGQGGELIWRRVTPEAPSDDKLYGRKNGSWTELNDGGIPGTPGEPVSVTSIYSGAILPGGSSQIEVGPGGSFNSIDVGAVIYIDSTSGSSGYVLVTGKATGPNEIAFDWIDTNTNSSITWAADTDKFYLSGPIGATGIATLQDVTDLGAITTHAITVSDVITDTGSLNDKNAAQDALISTNTDDIVGVGVQVVINRNDIATNTTNIATNTGDIATNTTNVTANTNAIATNISGIIAVNSEVVALDTRVGANETNIATNISGIIALNSDLTTLTGRVSTNETDIASNTSAIAAIDTSGIAVNAAAIASNDVDIAALDVRVTDNEVQILALGSAGFITDAPSDGKQYARKDALWTEVTGTGGGSIELTPNTALANNTGTTQDGFAVDIAADLAAANWTDLIYAGAVRSTTDALALDISGNTSMLSSLGDIVGANEAAITTLDSRVTTNESDVTALDTRVTTNENDITTIEGDATALAVRVTTNENDITTIENDITTIESDVTALDVRVTTNEAAIATIGNVMQFEVFGITSADQDGSFNVTITHTLNTSLIIGTCRYDEVGGGIFLPHLQYATDANTYVLEFNEALPTDAVVILQGGL